jgi:hypothetical protein
LNVVPVQNLRTPLPGCFRKIYGIANVEGMPRGYLLDAVAGFFDLTHSHFDPHVLERIGYRSEDLADLLKARRQDLVHLVLDRAAVA